MSETYRIGEVAKRAGVSVEAVRYYERLGLLRTALRTDRGVRRYPADTIERIHFVKQAQRNGFTLSEIGELIALKHRGGVRRCQQVRQLLRTKLAQLDDQRAQLEDFQRTLQQLADQCDESLRVTSDPECPVIGKI